MGTLVSSKKKHQRTQSDFCYAWTYTADKESHTEFSLQKQSLSARMDEKIFYSPLEMGISAYS